ncbi:MAG: regulatory protein RecX, partial [Gaiellales bacterium]
MAEVTGIRPIGVAKVAVDVDGSHWRDLPTEVVAAVGIRPGASLTRQTLRTLRRSLRDDRARRLAGSILERRDLSTGELASRLAARGVTERERERLIDALRQRGLVDDARLGRRSAGQLADRGWGDAAIRHRLEARGLSAAVCVDLVADLQPEAGRARDLIDRRRVRGPRAATLLLRRGFSG